MVHKSIAHGSATDVLMDLTGLSSTLCLMSNPLKLKESICISLLFEESRFTFIQRKKFFNVKQQAKIGEAKKWTKQNIAKSNEFFKIGVPQRK